MKFGFAFWPTTETALKLYAVGPNKQSYSWARGEYTILSRNHQSDVAKHPSLHLRAADTSS